METLIILNFDPDLLQHDQKSGLETWFVVNSSTKTFGDLIEQIRAKYSISAYIELRDQNGIYIPSNVPLDLLFGKVDAVINIHPATETTWLMSPGIGVPKATSSPTPMKSSQTMMLLLSPIRGNADIREQQDESNLSEQEIQIPDESTAGMDVVMPETHKTLTLNPTISSQASTISGSLSDSNSSVGAVDGEESVPGTPSATISTQLDDTLPNLESVDVTLDRNVTIEEDFVAGDCAGGSMQRSASDGSERHSKRSQEEAHLPSRMPSKRPKLFLEVGNAIVNERNSCFRMPQPLTPFIHTDHHLTQFERTSVGMVPAEDSNWIPLDMALIGHVQEGTLLTFMYNDETEVVVQAIRVGENFLVGKVIDNGKVIRFDLWKMSKLRRICTAEDIVEDSDTSL